MGVNSMSDDTSIQNESNIESKENIELPGEVSVCSSDEFVSSCDLQMLAFLKNLLTSCYADEVEKCSERPLTGVCHMMRAIETLRQELNSDREKKISDKRQKRNIAEMNKTDLEWVNLVLEFLQSKELRSAMQIIGCAGMEKEGNESDSPQSICYSRSEEGSACSTFTYPRSQNISHRKTRKKLQKNDGFISRQCKTHTSSKNIKKLKMADIKYLQRHPSAVKTKETQTNGRIKNVVLSKTPSSDDSYVFDVYPHERVDDDENDIYCPNPYQKYRFASQSTHINSLAMDNSFKSSSAPENVIKVSQAPISDLKMPMYFSYPQIHFRAQRNMTTQTEERKYINKNTRQSRICSGVTASGIERLQHESHKNASKLFNHEKNVKKNHEFGSGTNEIRKNQDPMTGAKPRILSQNCPSSNQEDVYNSRETVSINSMYQGVCNSETTNIPRHSKNCTSPSHIRCPEIRQACLGQRTLSAAFENYVKNKSGRCETVSQSPRKSCSSYDENQYDRFNSGKNTICHETSLPKTEDFVMTGKVPIQENDLNLPLKQISLSRDSQRNISIYVEVDKDIPKVATTNGSLTKDSLTKRENKYSSMESVIPIKEKVAISAMNLKFTTANKASQGDMPSKNPSDPEELNSSTVQSRLSSAFRKRKYSRSSLEFGQQPTPICTLTIQHRPTPFSCHSSNTDQTAAVSDRKRSPTPPADDCVTRQWEGRNRQKKYQDERGEKNRQNLTTPPEGVKEPQIGSDNGDKTLEEEKSSHTIRFQETSNTDIHLKKSRSIALSPVNFGRSVDKTKREKIIQEFSLCDDMLDRGNHNQSSHKRFHIDSLKAQIPEENTEVTPTLERDARCTEMAINMLLWQKDFFKNHLQRLSKICDILAKECVNSKSSVSSESEGKRRCNRRRKRRRRNQRERQCLQVLEHYFPTASDGEEGALSMSSSSTSVNYVGNYPLWWEATHSLACRDSAKKRPRKRRAFRAMKRERAKTEYECGLFAHTKLGRNNG